MQPGFLTSHEGEPPPALFLPDVNAVNCSANGPAESVTEGPAPAVDIKCPPVLIDCCWRTTIIESIQHSCSGENGETSSPWGPLVAVVGPGSLP